MRKSFRVFTYSYTYSWMTQCGYHLAVQVSKWLLTHSLAFGHPTTSSTKWFPAFAGKAPCVVLHELQVFMLSHMRQRFGKEHFWIVCIIFWTGYPMSRWSNTNCLCFGLRSSVIKPPSTFHLYTPSRQLRSSADTRVFRKPSSRTKSSSQRSFSYRAPTVWNPTPCFSPSFFLCSSF